MEDLLLILLQCLFEIFGEFIFDFIASALWNFFISSRNPKPGQINYTYGPISVLGLFLGGLTGGISILILPQSVLRHSWSRSANLVIGPIFSGWLTLQFVRWRSPSRQKIQSKDKSWPFYFWPAFSFTLGFVLTRFVWAIQ